MGRLDFIQPERHLAIRLTLVGNRADGGLHRARVQHAHAAEARQLLRERLRQGGAVHARCDRQQRLHDRCGKGCRCMLGLQAMDDLAREGHTDARLLLDEAHELRLVQPHQHRIADGDDRGGARRIGVEAHLADDLAPPHFAHHARRFAILADVGAQPAADRQVHRVTRLALLHEGLAPRHFHPGELLAQQREGVRIELAESLREEFAEQPVVVALRHDRLSPNTSTVQLLPLSCTGPRGSLGRASPSCSRVPASNSTVWPDTLV